MFFEWPLILWEVGGLNFFGGGGGGGGQYRERQIDRIFIRIWTALFKKGLRRIRTVFCPRNKRSLKKGLRRIWTAFLSKKPDLDRAFVPEVSLL